MEVRELRVGNLINQGVAYGNMEVSGYELYQFTLYKNGGSVADYYEQWKPAPLTEEWLLKFGFELDGEQINGKYYIKQFALNSGYRDFLSISDKGAGYLFLLTSNYEKESVLPFPYKYVHQLQNLYFALTNKELTIKETIKQ